MADNKSMDNHNPEYDLAIFEDAGYVNLLPLVYWRAVFELRCGCRSLARRICDIQGADNATAYVRRDLAAVTTDRDGWHMPERAAQSRRTLFVNGRCLLFEPIGPTGGDVVGMCGDEIAFIWAEAELAGRLTPEVFLDSELLSAELAQVDRTETQATLIRYPWDLVQNNIQALEEDWREISDPKIEGRIYVGAHLLAAENISIGPGSVIKPGVVLDAEDGPIVIGPNVTVKPNCTLEGPLFIGEGSLIQPGASIGEGVSIGEICKVGGELESSIIHSHSNKQHDGFLGHSYIGQWVNLAADTINSDLKNTYGPVRVAINGREVDSQLTFVGLTMGDHTKTSVNSIFSTGSVVGFACNLFMSQFVPRFVPSFSWFTDEGRQEAIPQKVVAVAQTVMARRNVRMTESMMELFLKIPAMAAEHELVAL